jgi:hypothetical protein
MTMPVPKARSIQKWFVEIGEKELDWHAESPNLNPIEHLWDKLECQLGARPSRPTSVPDLTNALVAAALLPFNVPTSIRKPYKCGGCYSSNGRTNCILLLMIFE